MSLLKAIEPHSATFETVKDRCPSDIQAEI
jgi:hypothetical protein